MNLRSLVLATVLLTSIGCAQSNQPEPGDRTRQIAAEATEKTKPAVQWLGRQVGQASKWAAEESMAFAEGVFEGWFRKEPPAKQQPKTDLNTATERELLKLPDVTTATARKIQANRPFTNTHELVTKGLMTEENYKQIRSFVDVR
jgi:hypothetical protein